MWDIVDPIKLIFDKSVYGYTWDEIFSPEGRIALPDGDSVKTIYIAWTVSLDGTRHKHKRIRRVSIDRFYETVTGEPNSFYRMCMVLPFVIDDVVRSANDISVPDDTVLDEIRDIADVKGVSFELALYMLGFESYTGFTGHEV